MYSDRGRGRGGFGSRGRGGGTSTRGVGGDWGNGSRTQGGENEDDRRDSNESCSVVYIPNYKMGVIMGIRLY